MPSIWKIPASIFAVTGAIGVAIFIQHNVQTRLPREPLPLIENDVVYAVNMAPLEASKVGLNGEFPDFQKDFRIRLKAEKMFMVETSVGWREMRASLYDEVGRQLGEMYCGFNARCRFFAEMPKDGWGRLRIKGQNNEGQERFSLEVREVKNTFSLGKPSGREGILRPVPIPIIDFDIVYEGTMLVSDAPLFWTGGGGIQEYRVRLAAGQAVLVKAKSAGFDLALGIYGEEGRLGSNAGDGVGHDACVQVEAPEDGLYTLRVQSRDVGTLKNGHFTLEVSSVLSDEQSCNTKSR